MGSSLAPSGSLRGPTPASPPPPPHHLLLLVNYMRRVFCCWCPAWRPLPPPATDVPCVCRLLQLMCLVCAVCAFLGRRLVPRAPSVTCTRRASPGPSFCPSPCQRTSLPTGEPTSPLSRARITTLYVCSSTTSTPPPAPVAALSSNVPCTVANWCLMCPTARRARPTLQCVGPASDPSSATVQQCSSADPGVGTLSPRAQR